MAYRHIIGSIDSRPKLISAVVALTYVERMSEPPQNHILFWGTAVLQGLMYPFGCSGGLCAHIHSWVVVVFWVHALFWGAVGLSGPTYASKV